MVSVRFCPREGRGGEQALGRLAVSGSRPPRLGCEVTLPAVLQCHWSLMWTQQALLRSPEQAESMGPGVASRGSSQSLAHLSTCTGVRAAVTYGQVTEEW